MHNLKIDPTKLTYFKKYLNLGVWLLKTSFVPFGAKTISKSDVKNFSSNFHLKESHFNHNYKFNLIKLSNLKQDLNICFWSLKTSFGQLGHKP